MLLLSTPPPHPSAAPSAAPAAPSVLLSVALHTPVHSNLGALLSYSCERVLAPGTLVRVPLGARQVLGVVWEGGA